MRFFRSYEILFLIFFVYWKENFNGKNFFIELLIIYIVIVNNEVEMKLKYDMFKFKLW